MKKMKRNEFDFVAMKDICTRSIDSFHDWGTYVEAGQSGYTFIDNGANILGVAHLDTVIQNPNYFSLTSGTSGNRVVYSPQLDDRLGVYCLGHLLELEGLEIDILLTEDEETGRSTGRYFTPNKQYNWMFQFDRRGDDVVLYRYRTQDNVNLLRKYGFTVGHGSFSDISAMEHMKCSGFNFGTGYFNEHTTFCYASMAILKEQMEKFLGFYWDNKDTYLEYTPRPKVVTSYVPTYGRFHRTSYCPTCGYTFTDYPNKLSIIECGVCKECTDKMIDGDTDFLRDTELEKTVFLEFDNYITTLDEIDRIFKSDPTAKWCVANVNGQNNFGSLVVHRTRNHTWSALHDNSIEKSKLHIEKIYGGSQL